MSDFDTGRLIYLVVLGAAVAAWFFAQNRNNLGKATQQAMIWGLIFLGVIAGIGLWEDIRQTVSPGQRISADTARIELPRNVDGHYYLSARVNGAPVEFVVDTGASDIVLTLQDAEAAGIDLNALNFFETALTANGEVKIAPVRLDEIAIGAIRDRGIRAVVNGGEMDTSLLGMAYLQRFRSFEISGGKLILTR